MKNKIGVFVVLFLVSAFAANEVVNWVKNRQNNDLADSSATNTAIILPNHAENFQLANLDGELQNFSTWNGKVRVLNFWATWCPPCLRETPMFVELQEKYQERGLQFVGVAIDSLEPVKDFVDTYGINYPILIGADDAIEVAKRYGNKFGSLPYTIVIDRNGKIVFAKSGEIKLHPN